MANFIPYVVERTGNRKQETGNALMIFFQHITRGFPRLYRR